MTPAVGAVAAYKFGHVPPPEGTVAFQVPTEFEGVTVTDREFVERAHSDGYAVHVWTINDEQTPDRVGPPGTEAGAEVASHEHMFAYSRRLPTSRGILRGRCRRSCHDDLAVSPATYEMGSGNRALSAVGYFREGGQASRRPGVPGILPREVVISEPNVEIGQQLFDEFQAGLERDDPRILVRSGPGR
jgi:hypothetical protein